MSGSPTATKQIDIDKLIIKEYHVQCFYEDGKTPIKDPAGNDVKKKVYGSKLDTGKIVVGTGCVLYDPNNLLMILANEKNKLDRIKNVNRNTFLNVDSLTYYEDFGGKVEDKHISMNVVDVAVSELYEESSLLFNFNYNDFKDCPYVLVDVPGEKELQYITFFLPFDVNVGKFKTYSRQFYENLDFNKENMMYKCQKQFLEISDINIFSIKDIIKDMSNIEKNMKVSITGFYGSPDTLYSVPSLCGNLYISSRLFVTLKNLLENSGKTIKDVETQLIKPKKIEAYTYFAHGMNQYLSKKNIEEANEQGKDDDANKLQQYLHKFFIAHAKISPDVWIGGDTPIMYYYDIAQSVEGEQKSPDCKYKITYPKVVLYTSSPCASLTYNTYMAAYTTTDTTNICLSKFKTPKTNCMFKNGVFFHINNRLYFSYTTEKKEGDDKDDNLNYYTAEKIEEYTRIYIGSVRIKDENIKSDDTLLYGQTLAFDSHSDIAMHCLKELHALKEKTKVVLTYFDCDEINQGRYGHKASLNNFDKLVANTNRGTVNGIGASSHIKSYTGKQFVDYDANDRGFIHIKGNYKLFYEFYKKECGKPNQTLDYANTIYTKFVDKGREKNVPFLTRTSGPFELDCVNNAVTVNPNTSIFGALKEKGEIAYNGLTFVSESEDMLPKFYLSNGLYDCYKYNNLPDQDNNIANQYVPLYRLRTDPSNPGDDMTFNLYKIAWECIYPSGRKFKITDVKYELIRVVKKSKVDDLIAWYKNKEKDTTTVDYWRRIIYLEPVSQSQTSQGGSVTKNKNTISKPTTKQTTKKASVKKQSFY